MRSLLWKFLLLTFLAVFIPVYFLNQYAVKSFDRFTSKALEKEMISHAFIIGEQYKAMLLKPNPAKRRNRERDFSNILRTFASKVQCDMKIVSPAGIILFQSDPALEPGQDISSLKEIAKAMGGSYGANWKLTKDNSFVYYYSALPIEDNEEVVGIAYITRHTGQITKAIINLSYNQTFVMYSSVIIAVLASIILALTMTHRLRKLTIASREYAIGNAPLEINIRGRDEIGILGEAVKNMATEIEKRNDYNREFMSAVIHELRTPITAIKGAAEILKQGAVDKEDSRNKFLANIHFETERLAKLVSELNDLTKLDAEDLRGLKETVNYKETITQILDRLMPTFDQKHATLKTTLPDENITVTIATERIEQVISNLLENAFRYTPPTGQVELSVSIKDKKTVTTSVTDSGLGIPASNINSIFDRFYTTEPKGVTRDYGSGLGLAIAKSIIENHHGRIWAESPEDKGASIIFTLPEAS